MNCCELCTHYLRCYDQGRVLDSKFRHLLFVLPVRVHLVTHRTSHTFHDLFAPKIFWCAPCLPKASFLESLVYTGSLVWSLIHERGSHFTLPGSPLGHFSCSFLLLLTFLQLDNFAKDKVSSLDRGADSTVSSLAFISLLLRIGKRLGRLQLVSLLLDGYLV